MIGLRWHQEGDGYGFSGFGRVGVVGAVVDGCVGTITIAKAIDGGDPESFNFTHDIDGSGSFALTGFDSITFTDVPAGTYSVSEGFTSGWILESATCDDGSDPGSIALAPDESLICTFTNRFDGDQP